MRKPEIAKRLARESGVSHVGARVVHQILPKLRNGRTAPFPGLGKFTPGPNGSYQFK